MKKKEYKLKGIQKDKLKKKLGEKCVYCNCNNKLVLTIDHKTPTSRGGKDVDSNKQVCCFICNQLKGALTDGEFKKYLKALDILKDLNKLYFSMESPNMNVNTGGFPLTEKIIMDEIKKEQEEKRLKIEEVKNEK